MGGDGREGVLGVLGWGREVVVVVREVGLVGGEGWWLEVVVVIVVGELLKVVMWSFAGGGKAGRSGGAEVAVVVIEVEGIVVVVEVVGRGLEGYFGVLVNNGARKDGWRSGEKERRE